MLSIIDVVDAGSAELKDARVTRGEAIVLALKPNIEVKDAMPIIIQDFTKFMSRTTGKMYSYHRESYSNAYRIQEPGRINFGIKISEDLGKIIIQPISILEDITLLKRYVQRVKRLAEEAK
ncbi:MAG: hypothetical protein KGZ86_05345 [Candidatus Latescibacteria bacterium]|nr:hypothetical protein [Candidatus Latescibacterota bacterium]